MFILNATTILSGGCVGVISPRMAVLGTRRARPHQLHWASLICDCQGREKGGPGNRLPVRCRLNRTKIPPSPLQRGMLKSIRSGWNWRSRSLKLSPPGFDANATACSPFGGGRVRQWRRHCMLNALAVPPGKRVRMVDAGISGPESRGGNGSDG